ncbi:hypothetical protein ACHAPT_009537 [Fusarium lateritium]
MSPPAPSSNANPFGSQSKSEVNPSMLDLFVDDMSPLPDRLLKRATAAATAMAAITTTTKTTTKDSPSNVIDAKDFEGMEETSAKL